MSYVDSEFSPLQQLFPTSDISEKKYMTRKNTLLEKNNIAFFIFNQIFIIVSPQLLTQQASGCLFYWANTLYYIYQKYSLLRWKWNLDLAPN